MLDKWNVTRGRGSFLVPRPIQKRFDTAINIIYNASTASKKDMEKVPEMYPEPHITTLKKLCIVVIFSIAFAYIEAAVVIYLRQIFYPTGFTFPLTNFPNSALWERLLLTEIGREIATLVIVFTSSWLFGRSIQERFAFFLVIFGVWDIFFYVWLKLFLNWPASLMDWDILFLIPIIWAGPVLAPILVSFALISFAIVILFLCSYAMPVKLTRCDWFGLIFAGIMVVVSFCIAGLHITKSDFRSYFYWPLFTSGYMLAIAVFLRRLLKSLYCPVHRHL
jgi:hypothetical protein